VSHQRRAGNSAPILVILQGNFTAETRRRGESQIRRLIREGRELFQDNVHTGCADAKHYNGYYKSQHCDAPIRIIGDSKDNGMAIDGCSQDRNTTPNKNNWF
jgi:hypothetical protein